MTASVLLVGLGQIGMGYDRGLDDSHVYTHARAFSGHPDFDLIGAVDPDAERRSEFEKRYGRPAYANLADALRVRAPECGVIAVPTSAHGSVLRELLGGGSPSVILCEKPLSYDLGEAQWMVEACEKQNVRVFVNYMRRSDPAALEIRCRLQTLPSSATVKGIAWYSKGLLHNGSHLFNLAELWLGKMKSSTVLDPGRSLGGLDAEPDVRVVFERGVIIFLAAKEEDFSHYTMELVTPAGRIRYERGGERVEWQGVRPDPDLDGYTVLSPEPELLPSGMRQYQRHVVDELAAALRGEPAQLCSASEALATLESLHRILEQR